MIDTEPTKEELADAARVAAKRKAEAFELALSRMTNAELAIEMANAESAGNARAIKAIKATREAKEVRDRARTIRASERAIEACERTGTPEQLKAEKARLEGYKAGGPLPDSIR